MDTPRLVGIAFLFALTTGGAKVVSAAGSEPPLTVVLMADTDDDDVDGRADGEEDALVIDGRADLVALDATLDGATLKLVGGTGKVRVWTGTRQVPFGSRVALGSAWQGLQPGRVELTAHLKNGHDRNIVLDVRGVAMRDEAGKKVDLAKSHASLERMPPAPSSPQDTDALRAVLELPDGSNDLDATVESYSASGVKLDALAHVALAPTPCPETIANVHCLETAPLRFVVDDVDRAHPLVVDRSLRSEVGGAIVVRSGGRKQAIRVLGPRASDVGPIGRYKVR
ncbi:MAG TPA: hypothetical protein VGH87_09590, partial [Polyangiaceae bacterium]